jgi:hypothetical protein
MILAYINYRHLNIGFLSFVQIDEYAFHNSLINMYEGVIELDLKKFFSFSFYSYGFDFFLINLIFTFPFFLTDNIEMTVYMPRIVSSLFAIGSLYLIYIISKRFTSDLLSYLIVLLVLSMPGFWRNAMWFHPDWMMTFFILLSIYFYDKDKFTYKKYFWYGTLAFGLAISSKLQGITFYPFLFFYIFYENFIRKNLHELKDKTILLFKAVFLTIVTFVVTNPYIVHPLGFKAWLADFTANMESNRTLHGSGIVLEWYEKIVNVIDIHYFSIVVFITLVLFVVFTSIEYFSNNKRNIINVISLYILINLVYLIFFVNKDWQHYYLTILVISVLLFTLKFKYNHYLIVALILINIIFTFNTHYKNFTHNPIKQKQLEQSQLLKEVFKGQIDKDTNILISSMVPFDYTSVGLKYKQMHTIYGPLRKKMFIFEDYIEHSYTKNTELFIQKDFIVIKKDSPYFYPIRLANRTDKDEYYKAINTIENFNNSGNLGYEKFVENKYFYIWRKKK